MGRKSKSITQKQIEVLSARVNYDIYKRCEVIAKRDDLSMTQIVRAAIREYLDNHAREKAA